MNLIENLKPELEKIIQFFKNDLGGLRTGRASPALVENILVEVYETKMPLRQVATINAPDSKTLLVEPWDRNNAKNIEKAIQQAELGLAVANEGGLLRITVPALTEETRKQLTKVLNQKTETARQTMRRMRDQFREKIIAAERAKEIGEDERFRLQKKLDETTNECQTKIEEISQFKEKEIMTI